MATAKHDARKILDGLPEEASLEDIQYHLYVLQRIERGREDVASGLIVPPGRGRAAADQVARRVAWTETAWRDLEHVANYIAEDSPGYTAALVRRIRDQARALEELSERGRIVPELDQSAVRELVVGSHRLIYEISDEDPWLDPRCARSQCAVGYGESHRPRRELSHALGRSRCHARSRAATRSGPSLHPS